FFTPTTIVWLRPKGTPPDAGELIIVGIASAPVGDPLFASTSSAPASRTPALVVSRTSPSPSAAVEICGLPISSADDGKLVRCRDPSNPIGPYWLLASFPVPKYALTEDAVDILLLAL